MTIAIAVDTSVAIPLIVASHPSHRSVRAWAQGKDLRLAGHALHETYAVLTRLPGDARISPRDAAALIDSNFGASVTLTSEISAHRLLAEREVAGGATYDGLVALAARANGLRLATRDARAIATYAALGVGAEIVTD